MNRILSLILALLLPATLLADGLIIIHNPPVPVPHHFEFAPLEVVYHRVNVRIDDQAAITSVDQEFRNPSNARLEGTYLFPLPEGASIDKFSMDVNGVMTEAELLSADKARAIYEDIVRRHRDPALLEYVGRSAFKVRIFPIEPHSTKKIKLQYTQLLKSDSGACEYVYPLNTEKFSSRPLDDVSIRIELDTRHPLKTLYCPSHNAEIKRSGDTHAIIGWEERHVRPDTDFKLVFSTARDLVGMDLLTHRESGEDGYFLLLASPGQVSKSEIQPKNIVFTIDTSGSMAGGKLDQAKKALRFCLENLSTDDHFDIVRFSTEAEPLFGQLVRADRKNIDKAASFVDTLKPMGGTAIASALDKSTAIVGTHPDVPSYILFMTDGLPTVGETREDAILKRVDPSSRCRIFTLGVGNDVNTNLLDRLATTTRAVSQYVLPKEDLEIKLSNLYDKIRQPVLTNLSLKVDGVTVSNLYPTDLPDLFNGDVLVLFGRYRGHGTGAGNATITLSGNLAGQRKQFIEEVRFPESSSANDYIPRLWATRRVGWLLDEIRLHGENSELKDEVIQLARTHGIVTPYTSYLIMEDEARHNVPISLRTVPEGTGAANRETMDFARGAITSARAEAKDSSLRTGERAVDNAQRINMMKSSANAAQVAQSAPVAASPSPAAGPVGYKQPGQNQGMLQNARVVNGRSFYQNGTTWVDANAQTQRNLKQKQIKLGSDEYFALLKANPNMPQWLSVGSEVDIVIGETLYQVR